MKLETKPNSLGSWIKIAFGTDGHISSLMVQQVYKEKLESIKPSGRYWWAQWDIRILQGFGRLTKEEIEALPEE